MINLKKSIISIILLISAFILSGCSSKTEVRDRAFVQAIGISESNDKVSVAVRLFDDDSSYQGTGINFNEALKNAQYSQGNDFFTGHTEFIVSASADNKKLLSGIIKSNDIPPSCTFIASDSALSAISEADCDKIAGIIKIRSRSGNAFRKSIWNVLEELNDNGFSDTDMINRSGDIKTARVSA